MQFMLAPIEWHRAGRSIGQNISLYGTLMQSLDESQFRLVFQVGWVSAVYCDDALVMLFLISSKGATAGARKVKVPRTHINRWEDGRKTEATVPYSDYSWRLTPCTLTRLPLCGCESVCVCVCVLLTPCCCVSYLKRKKEPAAAVPSTSEEGMVWINGTDGRRQKELDKIEARVKGGVFLERLLGERGEAGGATRWLVNFETQRADVWQEGEEICRDGGSDVVASQLVYPGILYSVPTGRSSCDPP